MNHFCHLNLFSKIFKYQPVIYYDKVYVVYDIRVFFFFYNRDDFRSNYKSIFGIDTNIEKDIMIITILLNHNPSVGIFNLYKLK